MKSKDFGASHVRGSSAVIPDPKRRLEGRGPAQPAAAGDGQKPAAPERQSLARGGCARNGGSPELSALWPCNKRSTRFSNRRGSPAMQVFAPAGLASDLADRSCLVRYRYRCGKSTAQQIVPDKTAFSDGLRWFWIPVAEMPSHSESWLAAWLTLMKGGPGMPPTCVPPSVPKCRNSRDRQGCLSLLGPVATCCALRDAR